MLPVEYRGRSLTKLDKMVDAFNHKEWTNDTDLLQDLIALRNEAKRHLTSSGKRKLATQTLIDKCNDAIADNYNHHQRLYFTGFNPTQWCR